MDSKYHKREYLPGYTGYIPKKINTCGQTVGKLSNLLVSPESAEDIPEDARRELYNDGKEIPVDEKQDTMKYGPKSKMATTWIGGDTEKIYPQHIPGI